MKLVSKVPIAAFLSGGLDSSIVCKKISDYSSNKLNTYTIYYDTNSNLDLKYANLLSSEENFNSHNILITSNMYNIENIDKVTYGVEEVLMDKVYIPMYFNYKAAHDDGFTVVISGQGSDEVWLGYIFTWKIFTYLNEKYNNDTLINEYYIKNMIFKDKLNEKYKAKIYNVILKYLNNNLNLIKMIKLILMVIFHLKQYYMIC
jgi:asparagine synthase (glutamine-hydrolysing)